MSGHIYPQISGQDGAKVHAGDKYNNITSNGPLILFGNDAIDTKTILDNVQQSLLQNYHASAEGVRQQLAEVSHRVQELQCERKQQVASIDHGASPENSHSKSKPEADDPTPVVRFHVSFTVRIDVSRSKYNPLQGPEIRFIVSMDSLHENLIETTHILANGASGDFNATDTFPAHWTKWKANYGIVMQFRVYLKRGWTFCGEDRKHFGGMLPSVGVRGVLLHHYCVAKFVNETDEELELVTSKNVHTIEKLVRRCDEKCCS